MDAQRDAALWADSYQLCLCNWGGGDSVSWGVDGITDIQTVAGIALTDRQTFHTEIDRHFSERKTDISHKVRQAIY